MNNTPSNVQTMLLGRSPSNLISIMLLLLLSIIPVQSFLPQQTTRTSFHHDHPYRNHRHHHHHQHPSPLILSSEVASATSGMQSETLDKVKADLVRCCTRPSKPLLTEVQNLVRELEDVAEQVGIGQASSISGLLTGEWELLYAPEDETRASPFFWAFRKAFPTNSDQIFAITDSIPAPIKEIGPAYQQFDFSASSQTGNFISRVKVATLGGLATSEMTTRGAIVGIEGIDGVRLKIETTKPEDSTVVKTLFGPFGSAINENAPRFPSGEALERVQPGSSEVVMRTTFCDEGLRISRNDERPDEVFVWRRKSFATFDSM